MPKTSSTTNEKIEVANPNTGRTMNIDADTWKLFHDAIKHALKGGKELTYSEMVDGIYDYFKSHKKTFKQSVEWYAVTVKHDLHVRKIIDVWVEKGRKLHRWVG
jgi:hypothetical protein